MTTLGTNYLTLADRLKRTEAGEQAAQIIELMREMNSKYGIMFVFATHDEMILDYMKQIVYMRDGKIISQEEK